MGYANATTWDSYYKGSAIVLSSGDLTATVSSGTGTVLATTNVTGKTYFEGVVGATYTGSLRLGVANTGFTFTTALGANTNGVGYRGDGVVLLNNATIATIATFTASNNVGVAIDWAAKLAWFRVNGGNWNNSGTADPATSTEGIDISGLAVGTYRPSLGGTATVSIAAKFASASWTYSAPSGFSSVETLQTTKYDNKAVADLAAAFPQYGNVLTSAPHTPSQHSQYPTPITGAWFGGYKTFSPAGTFTTISGVVQESGVPVSGKTVYLFNSDNGEFLGEATSNGSGVFSIPALAKTNVFAVALDPTYQAIVYDQLVPV